MAEEETKTNGEQSNQIDSTAKPSDTSEYLKPWMKNLGKAFSQNKEIAEYDSLTDCVSGLLKRPRAKDVPDSYGGIDDSLSALFRKSGLTKDEADAIDGYYRKLIPAKADLKEALGESYGATMKSYEKGKLALKDIAEEAERNGIDGDPAYVKLMAIIGDNTGSSLFVPPSGSGREKSGFEKLLEKAYGAN